MNMRLKGIAISISKHLARGHAGSHGTGMCLGSTLEAHETQDEVSSLIATETDEFPLLVAL